MAHGIALRLDRLLPLRVPAALILAIDRSRQPARTDAAPGAPSNLLDVAQPPGSNAAGSRDVPEQMLDNEDMNPGGTPATPRVVDRFFEFSLLGMLAAGFFAV